MKELPYYKMYPADAETDENFRAMTDSEKGFYWRCLNHCWLNGSLPAEPGERARALGNPRGYADRMWARVGRCFIETGAGRVVNGRQEKERNKALEKSVKNSANALRSHELRKANAALRGYGSDSGSESEASDIPEKPEGYLADTPAKELAEKLWEIHPSPSKFGFVCDLLFNELLKTTKSPEAFAEAITASLQVWADYWRESGRMATGLDNWIQSGDYARKPPPVQIRPGRRSVMEGI